MGTLVYPSWVKYFQKAISMVMDDLEACHLIIEQVTPNTNKLHSNIE
jgi:hypothetical protein